MRVVNIANEELETVFEGVFENKVASLNNIPSFDVAVEKSAKETKVEVTIYGFAGTPTQKEFEGNKDAKKISIKHDKEGEIDFVLDSVYSLNVNDYVAIYKIA